MASPGQPPVKKSHRGGAFVAPANERQGSPHDVGEAISQRNRDLFKPAEKKVTTHDATKRRIASKIWR